MFTAIRLRPARQVICTLALLAACLLCSRSPAQCIVDRVANPDPDPGAWDEMSLAADQDVLVVGALHQWASDVRGAVQVLRRTDDTWTWEAELYPPADEPWGCEFGRTVAISGDVLAVGAPCGPGPGGAVCVFERQASEWTLAAVLTFEGPSYPDMFATSVSVSGDWIAVGAPGDNYEWPGGGAVLVYHRTDGQWVYAATLQPDSLAWGDLFGAAVSLSGGTLVIGAPGRDCGQIDSGAIFVFEHGPFGWFAHDEFGSMPAYAHYGASVALHENTLIAAAPYANNACILYRVGETWQMGSCYLYPDFSGPRFGYSVAINDDFALIGHPGADTGGPWFGVVYQYSRVGSDWQLNTYIRPPGPTVGEYGSAVAVSDSWAAAGDAWAEVAGVWSGAADIVILEGPDCDANGLIDQCELLAGTAHDCNANDVIDICEVLSGAVEDCDGDEVPDECQGYSVDGFSGYITPFGAGFPEGFTLVAPPPAVTEVVLEFRATADLGGLTEWVDVDLNNEPIGRVFGLIGRDCPSLLDPDRDSLILSAEQFNALVAGGDAIIRMVASEAVDSDLCLEVGLEAFIGVAVRYTGSGPGDCNGNGVPDICEILLGQLDDSDDDGIPDICDREPLVGDTNCDGTVDAFDIDPFVLALTDPLEYGQRFAACTLLSADCNGDGIVNAFDIDPFVALLVGD